MRSLFIITIFTFCFATVNYAQESDSLTTTLVTQSNTNSCCADIKPVAGEVGVMLNVSGGLMNGLNFNVPRIIDPMLFLRYYAKDDLAYRLGVGVNYQSTKFTKVDSVGTSLVEWDSTGKKTNITLSFGFEKHFTGTERLDPYIGGQVDFVAIGKQRNNSLTLVTDTAGASSGTSTLDLSGTYAGGFAFNASAIIGFNYFFTKKMSLGAEYKIGYNFRRTGGDWEYVSVNTPSNGTSVVKRTKGTSMVTNNQFSPAGQAQLTFCYYF
jgi:hypothetical protein